MTLRHPAVLAFAFVLAVSAAMLAPTGRAPAGAPEPPPNAAAPPEAAAPPAEDAAKGQNQQLPTLFELLERGGPVMYPIYLCSFLMVAFAIERAVSLRRSKILPPGFILGLRSLVGVRPIDRGKILTYCQAHPNPIARIFQAAVRRLHRPLPEIEKTIEDAGAREVRTLRRNCRVLSAVAYIAPLLGLLGTVNGMIMCFSQVSTGEALGRAERLAEGIYQALVTTAAGLTVAIPAAALYLMFMAKIEKLVSEMDDLSLEFVESVADDASR